MIQQVNLYQDCFKQNQNTPAFNLHLVSLVSLIVILFCYSIYLYIDINNTKNTLTSNKQLLAAAETQVQLLQVKYPRQQINKLLEQEISRSQSVHSSLSRVIQLLSDKSSDQTQGFSRYFSALAQQNISEVWFKKITIDGNKNTLTLQGSSYNPDKIPLMLQKLHNEAIFQGKIFAQLIMTQAKDNDSQIDFTVSTLTDLSEQENHD